MSESCYQTLMLPNLKPSQNISVRFGSGGNLYLVGIVTCTSCFSKQAFMYNFIVCKNLTGPFIVGLDYLR